MRTPALGVVAAVVGLLLAQHTASAAPIRECGSYRDGAGIVSVTSRGVSCRTARRVARYSGPDRYVRRWSWRGYSCRLLASEYRYSDSRCTKSGGRVVRWQTYGLPE